MSLQHRNQIPDKALLQKVNSRLARAGLGARCQVKVAVCNGDVRFSGTLQHETQRRAVVIAAQGVTGVRRVVDQLQVKAAAKKWTQQTLGKPGVPSPYAGRGLKPRAPY